MKTSIQLFALLLVTLALSGCATGKCQTDTGCLDCAASYVPPVATVQAPAAPEAPAAVVPALVEAPAEEPVEDEIPATTRRYVSK